MAVIREYDRSPVSLGRWFRPPRRDRAWQRHIAEAAAGRGPGLRHGRCAISPAATSSGSSRAPARCASPARVLIAAYPSRGLDVGAINTMMRYFRRAARRPASASSLSPKSWKSCSTCPTRIAVMFHGEIMGIVETAVDGHRRDRHADGRATRRDTTSRTRRDLSLAIRIQYLPSPQPAIALLGARACDGVGTVLRRPCCSPPAEAAPADTGVAGDQIDLRLQFSASKTSDCW